MLRQNNVPEVKSLPAEHINLNSTMVWFPKTDCIYHLKNPGLDTTITFTGNSINKVEFIDLSSLLYRTSSFELLGLDSEELIFIQNQTLPFGATPTGLLLYVLTEAKLFVIRSLSIKLDDSLQEITYRLISCLDCYEPDNESIQNILVKAMEEVKPAFPVHVSDYPIFLDFKKLPTQCFLKSIYAEFFYHNEKKLDDQLKKSDDFCHIRAHFISLLLEEVYGIQTFKITKFWDWRHWTKKHKPIVWDFHCALMIMDQEKNMWVWDPWIVRNKELPTLQEWLSRNDEPVPILGLVTNSIIVMPKSPNTAIPNFLTIADAVYANTMQAVALSILPNSPELPISGTAKFEWEAIRKNVLFFKSDLKTKETVAKAAPSAANMLTFLGGK